MPKHLSIFYGAVINPVSLTKYDAFHRCLLAVGPDGTVIWIIGDVPEHLIQDTLAQKGLIGAEIVILQDGEFIIPGFIDTHTVEYSNRLIQPSKHLLTLRSSACATVS
jgi:guanine deaminase